MPELHSCHLPERNDPGGLRAQLESAPRHLAAGPEQRESSALGHGLRDTVTRKD